MADEGDDAEHDINTPSAEELERLVNPGLELIKGLLAQRVVYTPDGYEALIEVLQRGVRRAKKENRLEEVPAAGMQLGDALDETINEVMETRHQSRIVIDREFMDALMARICPLWPFC